MGAAKKIKKTKKKKKKKLRISWELRELVTKKKSVYAKESQIYIERNEKGEKKKNVGNSA